MTTSLKKIIVGTMIVSAALSAGAALAQDTGNTNSPASTVKKTLDLPCAAAAVAKREAAVSSAFSTKSSAISAALSQRATDLAAAWAITTAKDRNAAIKAAWKTFNTSAKTARTTYMKASRAAWTAFRADAKACRASTSVEMYGSGTDANL